jgi:glycosyltransferase involved in cell wall biosynthesis
MKSESLTNADKDVVDCLVLQVALRPQTGIWTLMRELLIWQNQQPGVVAIGGYLGDDEWFNNYGCYLDTLGVPFLFQRIPRMWRWGVERHLRQLFFSPVSDWLAGLQAKYRPRKVVIHFHDAWLSGGFFPIRKPNNCAVTCISTFNGIGSHDIFRANFLKRTLHRFLAQRLVKHQCKLVSVDRSNLQYASEFFNLSPELFTIIPNTVRDFGLRGCPRLSGGSEFVVGHVGSITESKGWRILAEAVLCLAARGLPVRLVVAGDGPEQPELQRLCKAYTQTINALGRVPHAGKEVIPKLDALGLISRWEGQPLCILEALCCGVPVIATDVGGIPETIADGRNGFIVQRDIVETADRIARLIKDPALHARMSNAARETFVERFHIDKVGRQYQQLWN